MTEKITLISQTSPTDILSSSLRKISGIVKDNKEQSFGPYNIPCTITFSRLSDLDVLNPEDPFHFEHWINSVVDTKIIKTSLRNDMIISHIRIKKDDILEIIRLKRSNIINNKCTLLTSYFPTLHKISIMGIKHIPDQEENFSKILASGLDAIPLATDYEIIHNEWIKFIFILDTKPKVLQKENVIIQRHNDTWFKIVYNRNRPLIRKPHKQADTNTPYLNALLNPSLNKKTPGPKEPSEKKKPNDKSQAPEQNINIDNVQLNESPEWITPNKKRKKIRINPSPTLYQHPPYPTRIISQKGKGSKTSDKDTNTKPNPHSSDEYNDTIHQESSSEKTSNISLVESNDDNYPHLEEQEEQMELDHSQDSIVLL